MMLDNNSLLHEPLSRRLKLLRDRFTAIPGRFQLATSQVLCRPFTASRLRSCLQAAKEQKCEGVMLKRLDGPCSAYEAATRSEGWLKLKKDYEEGVVDSLDLVPIAAWWGNGRKAGWFSPWLMACYNPDT